jgi:UDP-N-acetylglucosamine:LPS N-acetylglucosamine transferase
LTLRGLPASLATAVRTLFTSLRTTSHFLPLVPFIEACRRRGHEVAVAAPRDLAERVAKTEAAFFPVGHPGDEGLRPIWARLRGVSEGEATRIVIGEIFAGVSAAAALPDLLAAIETWRPSVVVRESQEYAAVVAAEKLGVPHLRVAITARASDAELLAIAAPPVDGHGRGVGLSPDPSGERIRGETTFTLFPASLEGPIVELSPARRFRPARKEPSPLPLADWWGARPAAPLVYLTLGTVAGGMEAARSAYRVALDAVAGLPIRVLLTIGAELPVETLGDVPSNVHVERFVPQDDVFPHASAVFCHGGSGTVLGTLAAGVPLVVAPMFADQPNNAARIAAIGAGVAVPRNAPAEDLRRALTRVLEEPSFRAAAREVAAEMAALPLVDEAAVDLERLARPA